MSTALGVVVIGYGLAESYRTISSLAAQHDVPLAGLAPGWHPGREVHFGQRCRFDDDDVVSRTIASSGSWSTGSVWPG
jgi:hypothetical protein